MRSEDYNDALRMFTLPCIAPVPSKKNNRRTDKKTGRSHSSVRFLEWQENMAIRISNLDLWNTEDEPLDRYYIYFDFVVGNRKERDVDNAMTSILDMLQKVGITTKDSWANTAYGNFRVRYEKNVWKAEVTIKELEKDDNNSTINPKLKLHLSYTTNNRVMKWQINQ